MALTKSAVRVAKPPATGQRKLYDEKGMFLIIRANGSKWWRLRYRFDSKYREISLGVYPDVSLEQARDNRDAARTQVANKIDPSAARKAEKKLKVATEKNTFEAVAREWLEARKKPTIIPESLNRITIRLEQDIFPYIGTRLVNEIEPLELLDALNTVVNRGAVETAHRILGYCDEIFRYAIPTGRCTSSPAWGLKAALTVAESRQLAAITEPAKIGELLRRIDGYQGAFTTCIALKFAPLVFCRPGELRHAEWKEIDFDSALWTIPAKKMKKRKDHLVPLSKQAIKLLNKAHKLTGDGRYVFPSIRSKERPMSENTITGALRGLGYSGDEMTAHGFRTMASTRLNEMVSHSTRKLPWDDDCIEMQLAHDVAGTRGIYNRSKYIKGRTTMMQTWANYLDKLRRNHG